MRALSLLASSSLFLGSFSATAAVSPEKQSARIARSLRGIPDDEWGKIAGDRITERYEIVRGDTLYGISGRLFGDVRYWPKIWELNNPRVLNPHFIYPKKHLTFQSGSGSDLPGLYVGDVAIREGGVDYALSGRPGKNLLAEAPGPRWDEKTPKPRAEWKKLPKQPWESIDIQLPPEVDRDGFDSRSYINRGRAMGDELPFLMACAPIEPAGKITGGRAINRRLLMGDEVTIKANIAELETGQKYSSLGVPLTFQSDEKRGWAYPVTGQISIIGVNDGVYAGEIVNSAGETQRDDLIVVKKPRVQIRENVNGPTPLVGKIFADTTSATFLTAQYKWIFIDRGSADGVARGMIFRLFQYRDPLNDNELTPANMFVQGDAQVYDVCENFALAKVLWSREAIFTGTPAILMTDVNDYYSRYYMNGNPSLVELPPIEEPAPSEAPAAEPTLPEDGMSDELPPLPETTEALPEEPAPSPSPGLDEDWLDKLDNGQGLSGEEEKELNQLEKYEEPPATPVPSEGEAGLPPPPAESQMTPEAMTTEPTAPQNVPALEPIEEVPALEAQPSVTAPEDEDVMPL